MGLHRWTRTEHGHPPCGHVVIVQYTGHWPRRGSGGITDLYWWNKDWFNYPEGVKIVKWMYDPDHLPEEFDDNR